MFIEYSFRNLPVTILSPGTGTGRIPETSCTACGLGWHEHGEISETSRKLFPMYVCTGIVRRPYSLVIASVCSVGSVQTWDQNESRYMGKFESIDSRGSSTNLKILQNKKNNLMRQRKILIFWKLATNYESEHLQGSFCVGPCQTLGKVKLTTPFSPNEFK